MYLGGVNDFVRRARSLFKSARYRQWYPSEPYMVCVWYNILFSGYSIQSRMRSEALIGWTSNANWDDFSGLGE